MSTNFKNLLKYKSFYDTIAKNHGGKQDMCESCIFYTYDDELDYYYCSVNLDEDEMYNFIKGTTKTCPYYRDNDDYKIVRKQN